MKLNINQMEILIKCVTREKCEDYGILLPLIIHVVVCDFVPTNVNTVLCQHNLTRFVY